MEVIDIVGIILLSLLALFLGRLFVTWSHEIPKRNKLLEEILSELKILNAKEKEKEDN